MKNRAMAKILLVEDTADLAQLIARELRVSRYEVIVTQPAIEHVFKNKRTFDD
jgi:DNA-binding response OmpR family regulator